VASGPFIVLAVCAAYLWGAGAGRAGVRFLSTALILVALTLILYGIGHWLRPVHAGGPEGARELKFRRTACAILLVWEYFIILQSSWIALVHRHGGLKTSSPGAIATGLLPLFPVFFLVVIVVLARLGQGGSRLSSAAPAVPVGDRTQDNHWKLGIFYFNRDDPAVVIEHRFGLGYTLNFARPVTWIIAVLALTGAQAPFLASHLHL
jgi:uncharacterized membrane protein